MKNKQIENQRMVNLQKRTSTESFVKAFDDANIDIAKCNRIFTS
jgi:hypothetical protein